MITTTPMSMNSRNTKKKLVRGGYWRHEVGETKEDDETRRGKGPGHDQAHAARNMEAGGSHPQATKVLEEERQEEKEEREQPGEEKVKEGGMTANKVQAEEELD